MKCYVMNKANKNNKQDISLKHDIDKDIKNFGTCMDKYGNYEYYYYVREDIIKNVKKKEIFYYDKH